MVCDRKAISHAMHEKVGHWPAKTTVAFETKYFWRTTVQRDARAYVSSCQSCQLTSSNNGESIIDKQPVLGILHTFWMDFAGPLQTSEGGKKYILVSAEHVTGWPVARAAKFQTSSVHIQFLKEEIVRQFGSLSVLLTDNGQAFSSVSWTDALASLGTKKKPVKPYSPQSNNRAERMVRTMNTAITKTFTKKQGILGGYADGTQKQLSR